LTAQGRIDSAIEAVRAGASEYLLKPVNVTELAMMIRKAMEVRPLVEEAVTHRKRDRERYSVDAILGEHPLIQEVRSFIRGIGPARRASVLLLGESGTGKNLAARAIHLADSSAAGQFVELNCAALPPALLEAELFGYMKGAFTDARENKPGLVEIADRGTLFLDEIGEMPVELQVKLLNFLESQRFRRLGGTSEREVEVRIVTATNRDLNSLMAGGRFREDLFYRIATATHTLPPLREIASDIPLVAHRFGTDVARELGKPFRGLTPAAQKRLQGWQWPGNVRELKNVMERALIFASSPMLDVVDLPPLDRLISKGDDTPPGEGVLLPLGLSLPQVEGEYIRRTMKAHDGKVQEAADALGISRKSLWEKRKRLNLDG
jgi:DNA-binding NtrC family response regulator